MSFSPSNKQKKAALRSLHEDLQDLGLSMGDLSRNTEGVTPVLGNAVHTAAQLNESRARANTNPSKKAVAEARARKARMEAVRRNKTKLREGVKGTAGNKWLRMYGEAKTGSFQKKTGIAGLVEDIQTLVAGAYGRKLGESKRQQYRRAFKNVAEVSDLLARRYEKRGGAKNESIAVMLRKMKAEAVKHFRNLGLAEDVPAADARSTTAYELPDPGALDDGSGDEGSIPANPNPHDSSAEGETDLENPSGDIGKGKRPGEATPRGTDGGPEDMSTPEDMTAEDIDLENPSGDIGKGKPAGGPTPTGDEPDWIDPDLRDDLDGYVGEDDDGDADDEEDMGEAEGDDDDESETTDEDDENPFASDDEDDDEGMADEDGMDPVPGADLAAPGTPVAPPSVPGMGNEGDEPSDGEDEATIKEMMRALTAALDDYSKTQESVKPKFTAVRR